MNAKKADAANLENKKKTFFLIGLVTALCAVWLAFEWKTYASGPIDLGQLNMDVDDEVVHITQRQNTPPAPPVAVMPQVLQIVDNNREIQEVAYQSTETQVNEEIVVVEDVDEDSDEVYKFIFVENKPVYPGCEMLATEDDRTKCFNESIMNHIAKNFKYPEMARKLGIQGRVFVNFVIEKDGSITNVTIARGIDPLLDDEALRVIKTLPKIQPAKQRGKPVRMQYTVPINAKIQ